MCLNPAKHLPTVRTGSSKVTLSLKDIERQQISRIARLTSDAEDKASAMQDIIRQAGLKIEENGTDDVGGPYAAPLGGETDPFNLSLTSLDNALNRRCRQRKVRLPCPSATLPRPGDHQPIRQPDGSVSRTSRFAYRHRFSC